MEKLLLAMILVVALAVLVRTVRRSIAAAGDPSKPGGCAGCPFDSKCEMQNRPHADQCGGADDS